MSEIIRPTNRIDPLDLELNWEIYECPQCNGDGEIKDCYTGEIYPCDNCDGTGELALYEKELD